MRPRSAKGGGTGLGVETLGASATVKEWPVALRGSALVSEEVTEIARARALAAEGASPCLAPMWSLQAKIGPPLFEALLDAA